MTTLTDNGIIAVAIVETTVLGATAHHAHCLSCGWTSKRLDGKRGHQTTIDKAAAHRCEN